MKLKMYGLFPSTKKREQRGVTPPHNPSSILAQPPSSAPVLEPWSPRAEGHPIIICAAEMEAT